MKKLKAYSLMAVLCCLLATVITSCSKDDPCDAVACLNGGACANGQCVCPQGYSGVNCEIPPDPCANVSCLNGGTCVNGNCNCPPGFSGANCETSTDPCASISCLNNGNCVNGACECAAGFEGTRCETESRDKFIGSYSVAEDCETGDYIYNITIMPSATNTDKVLLSNFYDLDLQILASINENIITINSQIVDGITISGEGSINDVANIVTLTYNVSADGEGDTCTATYTKQ